LSTRILAARILATRILATGVFTTRVFTTGVLTARVFTTGVLSTRIFTARVLTGVARVLAASAAARVVRVILVRGCALFSRGSRLGEHEDASHGVRDGRGIGGAGTREGSHTDGADDDDAPSSRSTHAAMACESIRLHFPPRTWQGRHPQWTAALVVRAATYRQSSVDFYPRLTIWQKSDTRPDRHSRGRSSARLRATRNCPHVARQARRGRTQ
ncbi:hypothetical protein, partial [Actinoplanes sp. ATCC 53533]|uniref:hypothetical protein n=1 Tax=Actinoplanes sp. ATCC 53533 TaxID=1288362 RepID=UPI00131566F9